MITASVLNSVTFKYLNGGTPNKWNTLHANRKQGGRTVIPYCQKFQQGEEIYLQFTSEVSTLPVLSIYVEGGYKDSVSSVLKSSYEGSVNRYFFNCILDLDSEYYDKEIFFEIKQGSNILTSEPIYITDLSEYLTHGEIKKIRYTNLDRNNSDLSDYWVDWSVIDHMQFYVEAVDVEANDTSETEVLTGSQSKTIISATNFSGIKLETGGIPECLKLKIEAASNMDYFEVNDVQYINEGDSEDELLGNSTMHQLSINLVEKNTIGLNVDDLGLIKTKEDTPVAIKTKRNMSLTAAGWQVENPEGYMLHSIFVKHASTSAGDAVINVGTTVSGSELIDSVQGNVPQSSYTTKWRSYLQHFLKDPDGVSNIYVSMTGTGAVLDMIINFDIVKEEES